MQSACKAQEMWGDDLLLRPLILLMLLYISYVLELQILETAFKKETIGLVTREQYVEKVNASICIFCNFLTGNLGAFVKLKKPINTHLTKFTGSHSTSNHLTR